MKFQHLITYGIVVLLAVGLLGAMLLLDWRIACGVFACWVLLIGAMTLRNLLTPQLPFIKLDLPEDLSDKEKIIRITQALLNKKEIVISKSRKKHLRRILSHNLQFILVSFKMSTGKEFSLPDDDRSACINELVEVVLFRAEEERRREFLRDQSWLKR